MIGYPSPLRPTIQPSGSARLRSERELASILEEIAAVNDQDRLCTHERIMRTG
jgi:hypothetical protein